jgi:hypothetical protein
VNYHYPNILNNLFTFSHSSKSLLHCIYKIIAAANERATMAVNAPVKGEKDRADVDKKTAALVDG